MKIAIAKESNVNERRVALVPDVVAKLSKQGIEVLVEAGAGDRAFFADGTYEEAGAKVVSDTDTLYREADILLKVGVLEDNEVDRLREGSIFVGFLNPLGNPGIVRRLAEKKVTAFSMEMIPRISRAQVMDALSSQANIGGYKAALIAATALPKFFPMLTTAAGTIRPAKVLVMGAGVAGLQAIATCRRLGAIIEAFDIRPEVKEQVQSLGAKFVDVTLNEDTVAEGGYAKEISEESKQRTRQVLSDRVAAADVVITTAQVPGKKAPVLVTKEMLDGMKPGALIVDLAAEQGGNCEGSEAGKDVIYNGVTIIGPVNLPSTMPVHASELYAKNVTALLKLMVNKENEIELNFEDEIIVGACVAHTGEIRNQRIQDALATAG